MFSFNLSSKILLAWTVLGFLLISLGPQLGSGALVQNRQCASNQCPGCFDPAEQCGNGKCEVQYGENCDTCASDCGVCVLCPQSSCGNQVCDNGETGCTCPQDCGCCLDGFCSSGETFDNCKADCAAEIRGKVVDYNDGSAIGGAKVDCRPYGVPTATLSVATDPNGNFLFSNVTEGVYQCIATYGTSISAIDTFQVFAGSNLYPNKTETIYLELESGILTGFTFYRPVANQTQAGVRVVCQSTKSRREGFSDENGRFFFPGIRPGVYNCIGSAPGFSSVSTTVVVNQREIATVNVFVDILRGNINGNVVDTRTGNKVESRVICAAGGETFVTNTTGGSFYFQLVLPVSVTCTATPLAGGYQSNAAFGTVPPGLNLTLSVPVSQILSNISGKVQDDSGNFLSTADVTCSSGDVSQTSLTDSDGSFILTGLLSGTYTCTFRRGGFVSVSVGNITLNANQALVLTTVVINAVKSTLNILVSNTKDNTPLPALLTCTGAGNVVLFSGNISGSFSIGNLLPGTVTCTATASGFTTTTTSKIISTASTNFLSIQLTPQNAPLSGTITGIASRPVPGTTVLCTSLNTTDTFVAVTDSTGLFSINGVYLGTYNCSVSAFAYFPTSFLTTVTANGANSAVSLSPVPGQISGRVFDSSAPSRLFDNATVNCTLYGVQVLSSTVILPLPLKSLIATTTNGGFYSFPGILDFGPWRCTASLSGFILDRDLNFVPTEVKPSLSSVVDLPLRPIDGSATVRVVESGTANALPLARLLCTRVGSGVDVRYFLDATTASVTFSAAPGTFSCTGSNDPTHNSNTTGPFVVGPGQNTAVTLALPPINGRVTVTVYSSITSVVSGALVICGSRPGAYTDAFGSVTINDLPRGSTVCQASAPAYSATNGTVTIFNNQLSTLAITLNR